MWFLYYHEVDFGAIGGVIYCHEICLVAICGSLYYHEVDTVLYVVSSIATQQGWLL